MRARQSRPMRRKKTSPAFHSTRCAWTVEEDPLSHIIGSSANKISEISRLRPRTHLRIFSRVLFISTASPSRLEITQFSKLARTIFFFLIVRQMTRNRCAVRVLKGFIIFIDNNDWTYGRPNNDDHKYPQSVAKTGFQPTRGGVQWFDLMYKIN